ncbi:hypothetical protein CGCF245_v007537 [Colletotrichum fructicola]|nr:hypothetical protein CGCF245_v007537 [Colletotrichum fructicola]
MSSPNDNDFEARVNNIMDLRECISGSREQLDIVRTAADRAFMLQQRGLQLNRGVTRNENEIAVELSDNEQRAYDIHHNVEEGHNNLEGMDIDSSPSDSPSQSTTGSASPDSNPAPAAVPVAGPLPAAPVPVAPVPGAPVPVVLANNLPTAKDFIRNAPALIATVPANLEAQCLQSCQALLANSEALAQAAAAASAASPNDMNLLAKSQEANRKVIRDQGRARLRSRVCPHCRKLHDFNDNCHRHMRDNHYRKPPYNHLSRAEHVEIAKAEAP